MRTLLFFFMLMPGLCGLSFTRVFAGVEPQIPVGASWGMTLEQARKLPELEHTATGELQHAYEIRSSSQVELVARWQGRAISFYIAHDIGLYAINIEMTPQALQHGPLEADQDLVEIEQWAPIRQAIRQKYGAPTGLAPSWDSTDLSPLSTSRTASQTDEEPEDPDWPYARNVLLWEGQETRLALGEQSVWYASRLGLAKRENAKRAWDQEQDSSLNRELERRVKRQQQIDDARAAIPSRSRKVESFF
jgi:hypothetical protein